MTATMIGTTGLIGGFLLEELLKDDYYDTVRILIRRPFELTHPKLEKKLVDFNDAESFRLALVGSDVVFCTIGTTLKSVKGDKAAYRKIDYDITVNAARYCKLNGCEKFVFVSAVGANSKSNNFYLKLKGEVEDAVKAVGIKSLHIIRPSLLLGDRKESRLGEKIAQLVMPVFSFLISSRYKPIHGRDVARAIANAAKNKEIGLSIHEYREMKQLSAKI